MGYLFLFIRRQQAFLRFYSCHDFGVLNKNLTFLFLKNVSAGVTQNDILMISCVVCYVMKTGRAIQHGEIVIQEAQAVMRYAQKVALFYVDWRSIFQHVF